MLLFLRFFDRLLPGVRYGTEEYLDGSRFVFAHLPECARDHIDRIAFEFLVRPDRVHKGFFELERHSPHHLLVREDIYFLGLFHDRVRIEPRYLLLDEIFCLLWGDDVEVDLLLVGDVLKRDIVLSKDLGPKIRRVDRLEGGQELFHETYLLLEITHRVPLLVLITLLLGYEDPEEYHINGPSKIRSATDKEHSEKEEEK